MGLKNKLNNAIKNPNKAIKKIYSKMDDIAGKKLFGNTVGLKKNLEGNFQVSRKYNFDKIKNSNSVELIKNQISLLGKPYGKNLIQSIEKEFNEKIEDVNYSFVVSEYNGKVYQRFIKLAIKNIPSLKYLLTDEIKEILQDYYQGNFKVIRLSCWRNYHVPKEILENNEIFSNNWHCDKRGTHELKLFVNVGNVSEEDGPFHVINHERTKQLVKKGFQNKQKNPLHPISVPIFPISL